VLEGFLEGLSEGDGIFAVERFEPLGLVEVFQDGAGLRRHGGLLVEVVGGEYYSPKFLIFLHLLPDKISVSLTGSIAGASNWLLDIERFVSGESLRRAPEGCER